ncbi:phosphoribosylaminoimidazolesuccinocarboxamide synthase [Halobacterium noricense]|uniref:phosphoribosylaminoimidazolesuccinocarboxamide synthase n=1 Tax=Halobacterium noricense TaxID=223182 RepID=UPI001E454407|nr:phosphoribosylaminoimidazolesuccinocarboxamide synthase [Halobacterium noricense]UHH24915.1 phosphoribosylaminoimidazolesuccinocarboxamide synthase [Halobacterium noricense]
MTSVKTLRVEAGATRDALGRGVFEFSDRYSVFDWGEMPDLIPGKGASLCTMGAFNFELLETEGVPTHYRGVRAEPRSAERASGERSDPRADSDGETVALADADEPPTEMEIALTQVPDLPFEGHDADGTNGEAIHGGYDYGAYHAAADGNYLVPLEVVFRNSVPVGSSLRKRRDPGEFDLDYAEWPEGPVDLPEPVVEFSTKYEEQDRYLSREEADAIAGRASIEELEGLARRVNEVVTERAEKVGFTHEDGKIECLYVDGEVQVADVAGTFDENRFAYEGREVSKEVVRQYYKRTDPVWVDAVSTAKAEADERGVADWRELCEASPDPLPADLVQATADMYAAGANRYTGHEWFDAPPLADALAAFEE